MKLRLGDPNEPVARLAPRRHRESRAIRRANIELRGRKHGVAGLEALPFFCECRIADCQTRVVMSRAGFDAVHAARAEWLLAAGHEPSAPWSPLDVPHPASIRVGPPFALPRERDGVGGDEVA